MSLIRKLLKGLWERLRALLGGEAIERAALSLVRDVKASALYPAFEDSRPGWLDRMVEAGFTGHQGATRAWNLLREVESERAFFLASDTFIARTQLRLALALTESLFEEDPEVKRRREALARDAADARKLEALRTEAANAIANAEATESAARQDTAETAAPSPE